MLLQAIVKKLCPICYCWSWIFKETSSLSCCWPLDFKELGNHLRSLSGQNLVDAHTIYLQTIQMWDYSIIFSTIIYKLYRSIKSDRWPGKTNRKFISNSSPWPYVVLENYFLFYQLSSMLNPKKDMCVIISNIQRAIKRKLFNEIACCGLFHWYESQTIILFYHQIL